MMSILLGDNGKYQPGTAEHRDDLFPVRILYGTHTGNSEQLAKDAAGKITAAGWKVRISDMGDFEPSELPHIFRLLVIVSTDGDGEPPLMAEALLEYLADRDTPGLDRMTYSVLALGDSGYDRFCQAGKDFDIALKKLGAKRMAGRVDCDVDYEENYAAWLDEVLRALSLDKEKSLLKSRRHSAEGRPSKRRQAKIS